MNAIRQHRFLGTSLGAAGLLRAAALLVAAMQLLTYREPERAYETREQGKH